MTGDPDCHRSGHYASRRCNAISSSSASPTRFTSSLVQAVISAGRRGSSARRWSG
jgi:hypothetical protein